MSSIFGGKKTSSSSQSNQAFGDIKGAFGGMMGNAQTGINSLMQLLGGDSSGFDQYKKATGFDAATEAGSRGITGNAAAGGLLRSGASGKALQAYGNQQQDQYAGNFMDRLMQQAQSGFNAGGLLSGAGNVQTGTSKEKPGIGGFLGQLKAGAMASDRRLKKNIFKVGKMANGLTLYQYRYINDYGPVVGVMADEVKAKFPEAMGPEVGGYMTVDYSKLEKAA